MLSEGVAACGDKMVKEGPTFEQYTLGNKKPAQILTPFKGETITIVKFYATLYKPVKTPF